MQDFVAPRRRLGALPFVTRLGIVGTLYCAALCAAPNSASAAGIVVAPSGIAMPVGSNRAFTATVSGLANNAVTWEVNGHPGGSIQDGLITPAGVYTAPGSISVAPTIVTIAARAVTAQGVAGSVAVAVRHQIPWLTTVSPSTLLAGSPFTLDVVGSRFVAGAKVFLNGAAVSTTFLDDTHLKATGTLAANQIGTVNLRVDNPGAVSSVLYPLIAVLVNTPGAPSPDTIAAVRFLEQATFGPSDAEITKLKQVGVDNWLAMQMDPAVTPSSTIPDGLAVHAVASEWFRQMATAPDQLRQRMAFALSQIFVVSMLKDTNGNELIPFVNLLSRNAFGNFRTLLQEVTLSPSMGKYLDMVGSMKPSAGNQSGANENYARELMQLFTIGTYKLDQNGLATLDSAENTIPTYDQDVVRNLALAFTGWVYPPAPGAKTGPSNPPNFTGSLVPYDASHDKTQKTIFDGIVLPAGQTASAEMNLALDRLFQHANVPPFFATRLIRSLVTSNPSPEYVQRVADVFVNNGHGVRGDLAAVLVATLTDVEARQDVPTATQGHLKDPVLHVIGLLRALDGQVVDAGQVLYLFWNMGEKLLSSSSVFSFYSPLAGLPKHPELYGPEFQIYTPALAIQRADFLYNLLNGQLSTVFTLDLSQYVALAPSPVNLVNLIDLKLFHGGMSPALRQAILADSFALTDSKQRAVGALYIAALSSEYAVLR